jgi:SAM-dependent methyltransferase
MGLSDCQVEYWNTLGSGKTFNHPVNVDRLEQWVGRDERIVDYGCGYGRVLGVLREAGFGNLLGVDAASAMIVEARRRFMGIPFECMEQPPRVELPAGTAGAVLLFAVLTCVPSDEGQREIVAEAWRLLRPGGILYISDLWLQTDARNIERYAQGEQRYGQYGVFDLPEGVTMRHHERGWMEKLTADYEQMTMDEIPVQTMNGNVAKAFQWFGRKKG